jgi:hypothetical protein
MMIVTDLRTWLEALTLPQLVALHMQRTETPYSEVMSKTRGQHIDALITISGVSEPFPA